MPLSSRRMDSLTFRESLQSTKSGVNELQSQSQSQLHASVPPPPPPPSSATPLALPRTLTSETVDESLNDVQSGITELEAPPPIQDPEEKRQHYLEDVIPSLPVEPPITIPIPIPPSTTKKKGAIDSVLFLARTLSWLSFFSILGTLSRLGLIKLTSYPGAPLSGVIWANFTGSLIIGLLIEDVRLFSPKKLRKLQGLKCENKDAEDGSDHKWHLPPAISKTELPLYLGLTTGYCGSLTSFSSFMLQAFLYLANDLPAYSHPSKGYSLLSFLGYLIATLSLSLSGLKTGAQLAIILQPILPTIPSTLIKLLERSSFLWGICLWITVIIMSVYVEKWRGDLLFACVFAPLGTFSRFWISKFLNPKIKSFPLGTFTANMIGTAILAAITIVQYGHDWTGSSIVGCQILKGVADGFCGCLTTVSTWVVEIRSLRRNHSYTYGLASLILGVALMVLVLGTYTWSQGLNWTRC